MTEKQIPESKIALNPVVIDDSKRGNPHGWEAVEPRSDAPHTPDELYDKSPMNPKNKKTTIKQVEREYTGIEFLNDVVR